MAVDPAELQMLPACLRGWHNRPLGCRRIRQSLHDLPALPGIGAVSPTIGVSRHHRHADPTPAAAPRAGHAILRPQDSWAAVNGSGPLYPLTSSHHRFNWLPEPPAGLPPARLVATSTSLPASRLVGAVGGAGQLPRQGRWCREPVHGGQLAEGPVQPGERSGARGLAVRLSSCR